MCGIVGYAVNDQDSVLRMMHAVRRRGPDGAGIWQNNRLTIGHQLLAVRTTAAVSEQPVIRPAVKVLAYNGELYGLPHATLDTTHLADRLAAAKNPYDVIDTLDGMYAFAWYHESRDTVILARDPAGTKPLYYTRHKGRLAFASELRGLLALGVRPRLSPVGLRLYLTFGYVPGPFTLIDGVHKIPPGYATEMTLDGFPTHHHVRRTGYGVEPYSPERYRERLLESVRKSLPTVRTAGLFLSGGLDSCAVLWALKECGVPVSTLTTRFARFGHDSDADAAAAVAKQFGTNHHELRFDEDDYVALLDEAVFAHDEPVASKGMPAYFAAHREARRLGWTVVFTGDGGDELLGGYARHSRLYANPGKFLGKTPDNLELWAAVTGRDLSGVTFRGRANARTTPSVVEYMRTWVPPEMFGASFLDNVLALEGICHLPEEYLARNDRLGMWHGLECRMPLLVGPFRDYALSLAADVKMAGGGCKMPAREAMRGILPDAIVDKPKSGWAPPFGDWLGGKTAFEGPLGRRIDLTVRSGRVPAVDALVDVDSVRSRIKLTIAMFFLLLWAEKVGLEP